MTAQERIDDRNRFIGMIAGIRLQIGYLENIDEDDLTEYEYDTTIEVADTILMELSELLEDKNEGEGLDDNEYDEYSGMGLD